MSLGMTPRDTHARFFPESLVSCAPLRPRATRSAWPEHGERKRTRFRMHERASTGSVEKLKKKKKGKTNWPFLRRHPRHHLLSIVCAPAPSTRRCQARPDRPEVRCAPRPTLPPLLRVRQRAHTLDSLQSLQSLRSTATRGHFVFLLKRRRSASDLRSARQHP